MFFDIFNHMSLSELYDGPVFVVTLCMLSKMRHCSYYKIFIYICKKLSDHFVLNPLVKFINKSIKSNFTYFVPRIFQLWIELPVNVLHTTPTLFRISRLSICPSFHPIPPRLLFCTYAFCLRSYSILV